MEWTYIVVDDEQEPMEALVARPGGPGPHPAVIVAPELFGVGPYLHPVLEDLAALGYTAVAPDFYHRAGRRVELDRSDAGRQRGFELLRGLTRKGVVADVRAVLDAFPGPAAMVGFSLGGHVAYLAATQLPLSATAVAYGGWLPNTDIPLSRPTPTLDLTPGITGSVLYVVGDRDPHIPASDVAAIDTALRTAGVAHEVAVLPGVDHAYFFAEADTYDKAAHDATWQLIRGFLQRVIDHQRD